MLSDRRVQWKRRVQQRSPEAATTAFLRSPNYFGPPREKLNEETLKKITECIVGYSAENERKDFESLQRDFILLVEHPRFATLSCDDCKKWWIDPKTGSYITDGADKVPRPLTLLPACETEGLSCPKGHHLNPDGVRPLSKAVWRHYWQYRTVGLVLPCPIVARNWALLDWIVKHGRAVHLNPFIG